MSVRWNDVRWLGDEATRAHAEWQKAQQKAKTSIFKYRQIEVMRLLTRADSLFTRYRRVASRFTVLMRAYEEKAGAK